MLKYCFIILFAGFSASSLAQQNDELQELLAPYSDVQSIKLAYQEKRYSLFLKQPKEFHGYMEYTRPERFAKHIESPVRKKFVIESGQLIIHTFHSDSHSGSHPDTVTQQVVSLDDYPQFKQFKALFSGLLLGDASTLTHYYHYTISPVGEKKTQLTLLPNVTDANVTDAFIQEQQMVSQKIDIVFNEQTIESISMTGFGGEKTEIIFGPIINKTMRLKNAPEALAPGSLPKK